MLKAEEKLYVVLVPFSFAKWIAADLAQEWSEPKMKYYLL